MNAMTHTTLNDLIAFEIAPALTGWDDDTAAINEVASDFADYLRDRDLITYDSDRQGFQLTNDADEFWAAFGAFTAARA